MEAELKEIAKTVDGLDPEVLSECQKRGVGILCG